MFPFSDSVMRECSIGFPMLGSGSINPPSFFTIFGRDIYYYGVIIAAAFMAGLFFCTKRAEKFGIKEDDVYDVMLPLLPLSIIGARIYYVLFRLDYYLKYPGEIIAVWEGGLAIYGGIIAGAAVVFFVCRRKKISVLSMMDLVVLGCMLGQAIGRWGNFINREAFGRETEVFCRMALTSPAGETVFVHPTFLYESLWNLTGFTLFNIIVSANRRRYSGQITLMYFLWYGCGRMWIEGLRTDSLYLFSTGIRVSQLLSLLLVIFSAALLTIQARRARAGKTEF